MSLVFLTFEALCFAGSAVSRDTIEKKDAVILNVVL